MKSPWLALLAALTPAIGWAQVPHSPPIVAEPLPPPNVQTPQAQPPAGQAQQMPPPGPGTPGLIPPTVQTPTPPGQGGLIPPTVQVPGQPPPAAQGANPPAESPGEPPPQGTAQPGQPGAAAAPPATGEPGAAGQPAGPTPAPPLPNVWLPQGGAIVQVLDKVNATTTTLTIKVGQSAGYGSLRIQVLACQIRPPDQPQDAAASLTITDSNPDQPGFQGWMLQNEPFLSMLQSPGYDVRVEGCTP